MNKPQRVFTGGIATRLLALGVGHLELIWRFILSTYLVLRISQEFSSRTDMTFESDHLETYANLSVLLAPSKVGMGQRTVTYVPVSTRLQRRFQPHIPPYGNCNIYTSPRCRKLEQSHKTHIQVNLNDKTN